MKKAQRTEWLARAQAQAPRLKHWKLVPAAVVRPVHDPAAWQHTAMETLPEDPGAEHSFKNGDTVTFDFGETVVGRITLKLEADTKHLDSPLRVEMLAAELPAEAGIELEKFHGELSRSWVQDEQVSLDALPAEYTFPRRYSLRYLRLKFTFTNHFRVRLKKIFVTAESAVKTLPPPPAGLPAPLARIDTVCQRTLRNCMQNFFEDGPKRDRRLWLGDLRIQAMVNAVGYRRFDLVERSYLLLAGCTTPEGMIPGSMYTLPRPQANCLVLDYALVFAPALLEHGKFSGRWGFVRDLYELARDQFRFARRYLRPDGTYHDDSPYWVFIDHHRQLDRRTPFPLFYIFCLNALRELAEKLGYRADAQKFQLESEKLTAAIRRSSYDEARGVLVSGEERQVSVHSQALGILSGVLSPAEGRRAVAALRSMPEAVQPNTPYAQFFLLEALFACGEKDEALKLIASYWGKMIEYGADTFWEAFNQDDDFYSPYGDPVLNSACHAWSCGVSYFLHTAL